MTDWTWPDAEMAAIIDGDTLTMKVTRDIGFGGSVTFPVRLRLNRINASPLKTAAGKEAATFLTNLLPVGGKFPLTTVGAYKYGGPDWSPGEWQAEITLSDGSLVSDVMVANGHAVYWNGQGPRPGGVSPTIHTGEH